MPFQSVDGSWSGVYAQYIILKALFSMDTLQKGIVAVDTGIKKIFTIDRLDLQNPLSFSQATPTVQPNSGWTLDSRTMTPSNFQSFQTANPRDLETTVWSKYLADPILEEIIPSGGPDIMGKMTQIMLGRAGESIETMFWQGSTAYQGHCVYGEANYQIQYFNGYLQRIVNDPLVNSSSISPVAITTSNILAILDDLAYQATIKYQALMTDENSERDMKYMVSTTTWWTYKMALANTIYKGMPLDEGGTPMWKGYKVERIAGMNGLGNNTVIFSRASTDPNIGNFHISMNSEKDWNLKVGYVDGNTFSEIWAFLAKWKMDVNYGWSDMIFVYTTLTPASFLPVVNGE